MNHLLFHGSYEKCLNISDGSVDTIITSPPYNIGSKSMKSVGGRKDGGFDRKNFSAITEYKDDLSEEDYQEQQILFLQWCARKLKPQGVLIYNHKDRHVRNAIISPLQWIFQQTDLLLRDKVVWDRRSTHNHCKKYVYQQHECLYVLSKSSNFYFKNSGDPGSSRKGVGSVWSIPKVSKSNNPHNAPFPLLLAERCVRLWTPEGGVVCDPYSGSGTTLIAADRLGRNFVGSEKYKKHIGMTLDRTKEEGIDVEIIEQ